MSGASQFGTNYSVYCINPPPLATKMRSEKEASKTKFTPCFCCCYDLIFHELFKGGEKKLAFKKIKDFLRGRREEVD